MADPLDEIRARAEAMTDTQTLRPHMPENNVASIRAVEAARPLKFKFILADDIVLDAEEEFAIEDLMPLRGLATVYGGPGSGKTFATVDSTAHIAAGLPYFGKKVMQGGVVYIAAEAGHGLKKRVKAWQMNHNYEGGLPFAIVPVAPNLGSAKEGDAQRLIEEVRAQLPMLGCDLRVVVIDTLARTMNGADENSASDMGAFIANADAVAQAFKCLVIAVHHTGKDAERGMRGSSALHGACDAEWEIKEVSGTEKSITLAKLKDGEDNLVWGFRLEQVTVFDPAWEGAETHPSVSKKRPITSCIVQETSDPKHLETDRPQWKPTGNDALVLNALKEAVQKFGETLPRNSDLPFGKGVKRQNVKEISRLLQGASPSDDPKALKAMDTITNRSLSKLVGNKVAGAWGEWVWVA